MTSADETVIEVTGDADVVLAGQRTKAALAGRSFDEATVEEVVLVVHELASNIATHAGEGTISLVPRTDGEAAAIEVHAEDAGPGIDDVERAVVDGYSTAGGLGGGLGTVYRLMDEVAIGSGTDAGRGLRVVATRRENGADGDPFDPPVSVGALTRAKPGQEHNGDAFLIEHGRGQTLVGVIDGLGHGPEAHRASSAAQQYVRIHSDRPLADLFAGVEQVCRPTRGVVMTLARFGWETGKVAIGGVGNITVRVCRSPLSLQYVPTRGVLGSNALAPRIRSREWDPSALLVLHSDGLTSRWQCEEFGTDDGPPVTTTAAELHRELSKGDDDATVLVVRGAA